MKCVTSGLYGKDELKQLHFYCERCDKEMGYDEDRECLVKMRFYHGTNEVGWKETQKQGYLLHKRGKDMSPCTYLAVKKEDAEKYGDIILEVEYDPFENPKMNNYHKDAWQLRVYEPLYKFKLGT